MTVQGYGCIMNVTDRKAWVLLRFDAGLRSLQIRGFVPKSGLARMVKNAIPTVGAGDLPDPGCDNTDKDDKHSAHDLKDPGFTTSYFRSTVKPRKSPYTTYNFRVVHGKDADHDIAYAYLLVNTTAVKSGGIVRAVIPIKGPADAPAALDQRDFMGYCDPNGVGTDQFGGKKPDVSVLPHVRWSYGERLYDGRETNIEGWLPTAGLSPISPPPDAPPDTPATDPVLKDPKISDPDCDEAWSSPKDRATGYGYGD